MEFSLLDMYICAVLSFAVGMLTIALLLTNKKPSDFDNDN